MASTRYVYTDIRFPINGNPVNLDIRAWELKTSILKSFAEDTGVELRSYELLEDHRIKIHATARVIITPVPVLKEGLASIAAWNKFLNLMVSFQLDPNVSAVIAEELEIDEDGVKAKFKHDGVMVTDSVWSKATNLITPQPRPEKIISWGDWLQWGSFLRRFHEAVEGYGL